MLTFSDEAQDSYEAVLWSMLGLTVRVDDRYDASVVGVGRTDDGFLAVTVRRWRSRDGARKDKPTQIDPYQSKIYVY